MVYLADTDAVSNTHFNISENPTKLLANSRHLIQLPVYGPRLAWSLIKSYRTV